MLEISLLGHFDLSLDGKPLQLASRQVQKLLAYLALNTGSALPRAKLAGILWLDSPESTARKNLRHYLWRLRQAIGEEYLVTTRHSVAFDRRADLQIDVAVLTTEHRIWDLESLIEAVSVYGGELLPGFYDDWVQRERERLQAIFEQRLRILLDLLTTEGRWHELITWSEHWIAHAEAPESAYRSLMVGYYGLNDLAGVAINYWRCKKALHESLGFEPSEETELLFQNLTAREGPAKVEPRVQLTGMINPEPIPMPSPGDSRPDPEQLSSILADLSNGNARSIDMLSQLVQKSPEAHELSRFDGLILANEIRSVAEQQSIPAEATNQLLALINEDIARKPGRLPHFLREDHEPARPTFVGRKPEMARLRTIMEDFEASQGQLVFVIGDIGSGKTSLLSAAATQADDGHFDILIGWGTCNAFSGQGDPYLPFRKAMSMLAGDIEQSWWSGSISFNQAHQLWQIMPVFAEHLLDYGPDLLDSLIPLQPLLRRLESAFPAGHPVISRLEKLAAQKLEHRQWDPSQLFEQVVVTLRQLAKDQPLLLLLDDLQWADRGSVELLFHLSRSLSGARIGIVCGYRSNEVTGQTDHPLGSLLPEFRRIFGDIWLDLNQTSGRAFIEAFVDSEPNRLDHEFRESLYRNTAGHPLFTVELLRDMQQKGDLIRDESGIWISKPSLDWGTLPARVDGAIESRFSHLDKDLRHILSIAAVEGDVFTVQVVARVLEIPQSNLRRTLFEGLQNKFRLVQELSTDQIDDQLITRYRFAHQMFQRYLYNRLSDAERRRSHGRVGLALEDLYNNEDDGLVIQLARHFDEAGNSPKAAKYLLAAGDKARSLFARLEAVHHYERALEHLRLLKDDERLARTWMRLGLTYHNAFDYARSLEAYNRGFEFWQRFSPPTQEQTGEVTLRLWQVEPISLDPIFPADDDTCNWLIQLFSGLVSLNAEKVIVPDVAHKWEILDDGRTYIFHLHQDLRWSDGKPLTAHDFILTWKRKLAPAPQDFNPERLFDIKGAQSYHQGQLADDQLLGLHAPDDSTLIIELERPTSYFLYLLATPYLFPRPNHVVEEFDSDWAQPQHIVTNGPFKIIDWSDKGQVLLGRNPYYHGVFSGNVSQVEISLLRQDVGWQKSIDQYTRDQIDFLDVTWFPGNIIRAAQRRFGEFFTVLQPRPATFGIHFNELQSTLGDARIRRALALTIDKEQLVSDLQKDNAIPALGGFIPPGLPGHEPDIGIPFDPQFAQRLLTEAGYPDGKGFPNLEIAWFDFPDMKNTADYISQVWYESLGIIIQPVFFSLPELVAMFTNGTPPAIYGGGWSADYHDPDCFLRLGMRFPLRHHQPILDKIEAARIMTRQDQRIALYREVDKMIVEDAITIPLHYSSYTVFFGPRVRKLSSNFRWCEFVLDPD